MLSVVPGISPAMARSLLGAYGSVAAVAAAAPDGLRRHPGIGRVRAARLAEALHGVYVPKADRAPEPDRPDRMTPPARRWILAGVDGDDELQSFDRRAIALRALRSAAPGTRLIDGLTGEVLEASSSARDGSVSGDQPVR
jgi:DNA excision repair protein ERCC-4/Fanconi anemia group M protein